MTEYLNHHLRLAGLNKNIFSEEAVFAIHQSTGGILRRANSVAKTAMLAAAIEEQQTVSAEHVRIASTELIFIDSDPVVMRRELSLYFDLINCRTERERIWSE